MSYDPQTGAELKALLEAEQPATRESKVIIGAKTKAEMLSDQTSKQQNISTKTQTKVSELKINRADVDTTKVSFGDYLESTDASTSFEEALEAYNNKQNYDRDLETELRNQLYESNRDRTLAEVASDTALSTGKIGVTMGQMGLGIADLAGRVVGVDNVGDTLNKNLGSVVNTVTLGQLAKDKKLIPNDAIEQIDKQMSTKMQAQQQNVKQRVAAVAEQNKKDIAALGENASWWDKFNAQGKEFDEQLSALIDNPTALSDVALSSALAFTVPAVVGKAAKSYAKKQGIEDAAQLERIGEAGAVAGIAGLEGFSQAYEEKQKVLDMPVEQLAKTSPKFLEYVDKYGVEKAKQMIADAVYTSNLGLMAVASAVAAKRTGAAVLEKDLFVGSNVLEAIGKEAIEETAQSGAGTLIQNWTEQRLVDENQEIQEGLGQSVATGLAGAVTSTAAISGTANTLTAVDKKAGEVVQKAVKKVADMNALNSAINEAVSSGNFESITKVAGVSNEEKVMMLLSSDVLQNASKEQKFAVQQYVNSVLGEEEETTTEPTTKEEIKKAELTQLANEMNEQVGKQIVEPILGNLDSITVEDEDMVIKVLGSSPNSFNDDDLVNLSSSVSDDNKPIIDAVIESRRDIAAIESARESKDIIQVNQDVINGGKGFLGLRNYQDRFQKAISSGSTEKATKAVEMLNNFTTLQAQKLEDIKFIYQLAQEGIGTLALEKLNEEYRTKYSLPQSHSIHRGSGKLVNTVAMEVQALNSGYKAMGAIYQKATGQSPMVLPAVTTSFVMPTERVKPVSNVAPVQAETLPAPVVTDQLTEDTAQAFVPPEQTQPTAAPETPKATTKKQAKVTKEVRSKSTPVEEAKPVASSEAATATEAVADETTEPVQEDASKLEAPVEAPKKLTRQRIFEFVTEGVIEPVNKVMRKIFIKEDVNQDGINKAIKDYSSRLGKNMKRLGEERIKERIAAFSKGIQDAVDYTVDEESKDNDYREGVKAARENIKFNTAKVSVTNRIFDNAIGRFFKVINKDTLFNRTPLIQLALLLDEKFKALPSENQAVIKNFTAFRLKFHTTLKSIVKKPYNLNNVIAEGKNDYVHLFMDEGGSFDSGFVTAMSLAAHNWLTQSASSLVSLDEEQIIELLGLPENTELDPKVIQVFSKLGTTRETVADDLGKAVITIMGYQFNKDITEAEQTTMYHSIGLMVIATLQDSGYVETTDMDYRGFLNSGLPTFIIEERLSIDESTKNNPELFKQGLNDVLNFKVDKNNKNPDYLEGVRTGYKKTVYLRPVTKKQPIPSKDDTEGLRYYDGMQDDIHEAITLARNERLAEVEPILNKIFDVEETLVNPVFTKPTKIANKIKNDKRKKMSAKQYEAVKTMSERPWGMSSVANVFNSLSGVTQQKIAGYKTDEEIAKLHVTEREKAKTNNDSIMRTIGYFTDFYNAAAEKDFYLPVFVAKNNRMFYSSNTINPQTNKIIRRLINLKSNAVKVDLTNKEHEQNFRVALMDAFDIKVNWKNLVEAYQNGNDALTKFLELPEVKDAVQGILDGDLRDGTPGHEALLKVVERAGTGYHAVQGLIALAQKEQAKGKPFETDLLVEIDGVANGVAILMWQFAGSEKDTFKNAMNRAGIYEEGDVTSFTEYAGKGNSDSYQELTKYWDIALNELTEAVLNRSFNPFNPNSVLVRKDKKGKPLKYDIDKLDDSLKAISSLVSVNGKENPQEEYQVVNAMRMLIGPLVDENGVTKMGRNLAKPPTMTSSYNAGFDSIMENVLNFVLGNVYEKLQNHPLKDKDGKVIAENQQVLAELSKSINILYGEGTVSFETDNNNGVSNLEWTIDSIGKDAKANFDLLLKNTFGAALNGALNKVYGRLLRNRTVASDVARYAFLVFKSIYDNTVESYLEANNKTSLSLEDKEIIMNQLKDLWPVLHTQSSVNPEEGIFLFKEKTRKVYGRTGNKEKDKAKVQSFTVKQEYARTLNNNGKDGFKTASAVGKESVLEEPGAGTIPLSTQSIDAHSMFNFQAKYAALNNHDAIGIPITMASFLGSEMNTSFQEVAMGDYNIEGELSLLMAKYLDLAKKYKVDKKVWNAFESKTYDNAEALLERINSNYAQSANIRASFDPYAVSQYDLVGAAKINDSGVVSDEEAAQLPAQIIAEAVNDVGSKAKDNAIEDYSNATTEVLNADNTIDIFNRLHAMGIVTDNIKHTEALRSLLQEVINKVLTPVNFVLGTVDADTRGRFIMTKRGLNTIEQAVGNKEYGMSAQEVYVHELVHAVVENALSSGTVAVKRVTAMFEAVKSLVDKGDITYKDFLPLDANGNTIANPTAEQEKDAQDRLDYIFNNPDIKVMKVRDPDTGFLTTVKTNPSLSEFVAIGVTNEAFKKALNNPKVIMALQTQLKPERTKTTSNSWVIQKFDNFVNYLLDMVQFMLDRLTDKIFGLNGKPMDEQLVVLVSQLAGATGKHQSKVMQMLDSITEHRTAATAKLKSWVVAPLVKVAQSNMVKGSRVKVIRTAGRLVTSINNSQAGQWTKALRQVRSRIKMTEDNFAQAVASEMIGVTSKNRKWHVMLRISNMMVDQLRKHTQTMVKNILNEQFSTKLNVTQKKAMTTVIMRTDISALLGLGYTHEQIQDFIKDKTLLDAEVTKLGDALKAKYKLGEGKWMYKQAVNLAKMMVFGVSTTPNALKNAHNIAKRFGRDNKTIQPIDEVAAENELEVLVSLMALQLTDDDSKKAVIDVLDSEVASGKSADDNGLTYVMEFHKNYVEDSIGTNFKGDKTQTRKGYVKEQYDPNIDIKYGDDKPETQLAFKKLGYELTKYKVESDGLESNQSTLWVYRNKSAKLATNSAGITSFTGTSGRGTDLTDKLLMDGGSTNIGLDAYLETKDIEKLMSVRSNLLRGQDDVTETSLLPTFDSQGNVVRYSYEMSLATKRELMKIEEGYDDLLAHMQAHIKDKANSEQINNLVVQTLKEEFDADFTKSPKDFTYVGPDSPNPKMKELWFTLPDSMRAEFGNKFKGKKGFYVKTRNLRLIFGFRKFTIGELFKRKDAAGNANKTLLNLAGNHIHALLNRPFVHNTEEMWQEVVRMAKDTIVVKTGATLVGNIVSNVAVLATEGVAFSDMIKYGTIAWKGATKYQKDRSKLDRMKSDLANKTSLTPVQVSKLKRDIALLENEMSTNPVYELIQAGIYQTIVEDVDMDDNPFSFKSKLEQKVDPILDKVPAVIRDTGKILFMTHDTQLYKAMRNATQLSDFVGRFILHEHNKNKLKLSREESIDNIVETFVNYDLPSHRSIQYLNDMGFIMFSKFFMRIQKVILRQLSTRLANVIGLLTIQQLLGINIADIFDGNIFADNVIMGKFASPDDHLDTLLGLHLVNNF